MESSVGFEFQLCCFELCGLGLYVPSLSGGDNRSCLLEILEDCGLTCETHLHRPGIFGHQATQAPALCWRFRGVFVWVPPEAKTRI